MRKGEDPSQAAAWTNGRFTLDQYQSRYTILTADQFAARIESIVEAGADHIIVYLAGLAYDQDMLYRFAQEIIPRFA